ncbi:MAG: DUF2203 domain-containing protein [Chloroflexota bacterium]|nr:DUF2203 domain-containing protein [Dehalococcoidia bacterium]MEC8958388.1 DUF2203 domain-containing protein [Chloroflexota bacterium]MEE3249426.1 DUF2203 domain-containing protein [Chloroflexota bacterium]|tara:strand:- start:5539 stop:5919 length:381 start_codon:yes stop_codon:yes gene_type:complete
METDQFTLDEANSLIPWLVETFRKLELLRQEYTAIQERFADLERASGNLADGDKLKVSAEHLARQIEEGVEEILDKGILIRDVSRGLVDFPSHRNGREVYLCWIGGEERIDYWHETDRGFSHREPL